MPSTTLYLVRHGEADDAGGPVDPGLSDDGVRQSRLVAERLGAVGVDEILHSSKRRAVETASILGDHLSLRPRPSSLLDDRTPIPDDWSDVPDPAPQLPAVRAGRRARSRRPPTRRCLRRPRAITDTDRCIVAVTHNFVIGWFVRHVLDAPWWRWIGLDQANGGISTIEWTTDPPPRLHSFDDTGHLALGRR